MELNQNTHTMQKIENIGELVKFISENFDQITEDDYYHICWQSLGLITRKPETVTEAINEVTKFYDIIKDIPPGYEKPFMLIEGGFDNE
jgi:hypothetical protein